MSSREPERTALSMRGSRHDSLMISESLLSINTLFTKLYGIANVYAECRKSGKAESENEQIGEQICVDIQKTHTIIDKAVRDLKKHEKELTIHDIEALPIGKAYSTLLGELRFGYVDFKEHGSYQHHFSTSISGNNQNLSLIHI